MSRILTANEIGELAKKLSPKHQQFVLTNITMLLFQEYCDAENGKNVDDIKKKNELSTPLHIL